MPHDIDPRLAGAAIRFATRFAVAKAYHRAKKYVNRVVRKMAENIRFCEEGSGIQNLRHYIWS